MWYWYVIGAIAYFALMGFALGMLNTITDNYLLSLNELGNDAVRKYYERMHQIEFTKINNRYYILTVAYITRLVLAVFWPIVYVISLVWTYVDYKRTYKEFTTE